MNNPRGDEMPDVDESERPLKVVGGSHVEWVEEEAVILDPDTGVLNYLNPQAALVYALIEEHGYERALTELRTRFGDDPSFDDELAQLLQDMVDKGLLERE